MRGFASNFGLAISLLAGISGIFLITRTKTGNTVTLLSSNIHTRSSNINCSICGNFADCGVENCDLCISCCKEVAQDFEAEIIGDYIAHGVGGSAFRLPSGDVLKIISLENDSVGEGGSINREQARFIEDLWMKQLGGENSFISDFADIKHYHRGYAGPRMTQLVNTESPAYAKRPLKVGEKVAYWVMEHIPTIGKGEMSEARIRGGQNRIKEWGKKHGYEISDLHTSNFGERADGTFVAFDPWPTKISKKVNNPLDR